jgi:hypothetical protein
MKKSGIVILSMFATLAVKAQILKPVKWSYGSKRLSPTEAVVFLKADIDPGWHVYSQHVPDGGPVKTSFIFLSSTAYLIDGPVTEPHPVVKFEKVFNMNVSYFGTHVIFQQKVKLKTSRPVTLKGTLEYMTCNDRQCLPPEDIDFTIEIK